MGKEYQTNFYTIMVSKVRPTVMFVTITNQQLNVHLNSLHHYS